MITNFGEEGTDYTVDADGTIVTSQDLVDSCAGASDVAAAVRGELGLGLQGLAQYVDESLDAQITDPIMVENGEQINAWTEEGLITFCPAWPPFTPEETSRIAELEEILQHVVIVDESNAPTNVVTIGCKVTVADKNGNTMPAYKIVGSQESDPMNGVISEESPFGRALLGAKEGDTVTVEAPSGAIVYTVQKIER